MHRFVGLLLLSFLVLPILLITLYPLRSLTGADAGAGTAPGTAPGTAAGENPLLLNYRKLVTFFLKGDACIAWMAMDCPQHSRNGGAGLCRSLLLLLTISSQSPSSAFSPFV